MNGSVSDSTTTYGANVTVTCDNGYDLSASAEITCQADGTWNDIPTCVENGIVLYSVDYTPFMFMCLALCCIYMRFLSSVL